MQNELKFSFAIRDRFMLKSVNSLTVDLFSMHPMALSNQVFFWGHIHVYIIPKRSSLLSTPIVFDGDRESRNVLQQETDNSINIALLLFYRQVKRITFIFESLTGIITTLYRSRFVVPLFPYIFRAQESNSAGKLLEVVGRKQSM